MLTDIAGEEAALPIWFRSAFPIARDRLSEISTPRP
jgi:hypothetical protein